MKVGIIIGSIRDERAGEAVGAYVADLAAKRGGDTVYEIIDLKVFDVPLFTSATHPMAAKKQYDNAAVQAWSDAVDACDAYIFVTPEYNHGVPGALKNAVDSLGAEWMGKPVGFVGYGAVGGVRAIENWRLVLANFSMVDVRPEANFNLFTDWADGAFTPAERQSELVGSIFDAVERAAAQLAR